jgi:TusA-related sulfurtransferase
MSDIEPLEEVNVVDLTMYGCPMHFLKVKDLLRSASDETPLLIEVNKGKAVTEVLDSLRKDHFVCSIENEERLTTIIRVTKSNDR